MRRTVFCAVALAGTAVLAGAVPALADEATPVPTIREATTHPSPVPATNDPIAEQADTTAATPVPSVEPTEAPEPGQVSVVPSGAPDTGVATESAESGTAGAPAVGGGAAAVLVGGGAAVLLVRRRRATKA